MSSDDFLKNLFSEKANASQIIVSEVQPNNIKTEEVTVNHPFSEVSIGLIFISGLICFLMYSKRWAVTREDIEDMFEGMSSQIPCRKCRFFSHNPYLKCAVQPTIAMTKEAIHCVEFRSKKK
ncbi:hypothetical protein [Chroococcidiopsis thermalis]|uniref:Uncharacterized protein n=1 Tax=Chroococcidiopsis thermalis (strain PCC 7203) TaxID=251229 RepID=K9U5Z1_CHRTP|nr:hypothetical protein [Chroococcidiopsis thermalis]AFY89674.1 hypothetical protein Chro_4275 [Chroococcidiopsis thermalis PCC 7203]PSB41841.1 hypothetical protein C7B80_29400 [Cyanosarcina cf. burmensis CCALA 770]